MRLRTGLAASALAMACGSALYGSAVDKVTHYNGGTQIWIKAGSFDPDTSTKTLNPSKYDFTEDTDVAGNTLSGHAYYYPNTDPANTNTTPWYAQYTLDPSDPKLAGVSLSGTWGFYARTWQPAQEFDSNNNGLHYTDSDWLFVKGDPNDGSGPNWYNTAVSTAKKWDPPPLDMTGSDRVLNDIFHKVNNGSDFQWLSTSGYWQAATGEPSRQYDDVLITKTFNPAEDNGKITFVLQKREFGEWNARVDYIVWSDTPNFDCDFGEWSKAGGGNWNDLNSWTHKDVPVISANLLGGITADSSVNIGGGATVRNVRFDNTHKYTITGSGPLNLFSGRTTYDSSVETAHGNHEIAVPFVVQSNATFNIASGSSLLISGGLTNSGEIQGTNPFQYGGKSITKTGGGTLTISGSQSWNAGSAFNARGGVTNINADVGSATAFNAAVSAANAGTTLNFGASQHLLSLNVGDGALVTMATGGNKVLVAKTFAVAGTGKLNLKDEDMIVGDNAHPAALADVRTAIVNKALFTDVAGSGGKTTALGYAAGNDANISALGKLLGGEAFEDGSVIVKYTYQGDADLDGDVDGDDVAKWAVNFTGALTNPTNPKLWTSGDWDYDGDVDGDDVAKWAVNFTGALTSGGLTVTAPGALPEAIAILNGMGINVAVPEPASLGLLAVGAMGLLARRRRS